MTYDLDAAIREDRGTPFVFKLGDTEFTLPHMKDMDKETLSISDGQPGQAALETLRIALGPQWRHFNRVKLSVDGVEKLYEAWGKHSGVESGE